MKLKFHLLVALSNIIKFTDENMITKGLIGGHCYINIHQSLL